MSETGNEALSKLVLFNLITGFCVLFMWSGFGHMFFAFFHYETGGRPAITHFKWVMQFCGSLPMCSGLYSLRLLIAICIGGAIGYFKIKKIDYLPLSPDQRERTKIVFRIFVTTIVLFIPMCMFIIIGGL